LGSELAGEPVRNATLERGWEWLQTPGDWEKVSGGLVEAYDGYAWYRFVVDVPEGWRGGRVHLDLGRIWDSDETFLNGKMVGSTGNPEVARSGHNQERKYELPPDALRFGAPNLFAVRVFNARDRGGIHRGPLSLTSRHGRIELNGRFQFRFGDDTTWAQWPAAPDSSEGRAFAETLRREAGLGFGKFIPSRPLPGTTDLELEGDLASYLVEGVDRFLLRKTEEAVVRRGAYWKRDVSSHAAYDASVAPLRQRLARIIGAQDSRRRFEALEYVATTQQGARIGSGRGFEAFAVRWPVVGEIYGEGLLLVPDVENVVADIVALPDADQTPEMLVGLVDGVAPESQYARHLAESGCRVVIPTLIHRAATHRGIPDREFLYRSAFEMGRHLIGYEVQKVLAVVDAFALERGAAPVPMGVLGWGEGGLIALHAAALDTRIRAACVSGYFDSRQSVWQEPVYRNVFGLLERFGDAELASLVAPRALVVEAAAGPEVVVPSGGRAGPGRLTTPKLSVVKAELARVRSWTDALDPKPALELVVSGKDGSGPFGSKPALDLFLKQLAPNAGLSVAGISASRPKHLRSKFDPDARQARARHGIDRYSQALLTEGPFVRKKFLARLDTTSPEKYAETAEPYRDYFYEEIIGRFDDPLLEPRPRTRQVYDDDGFKGYEVVLDVFPDVIAYGILLVPKDCEEGDRRPVVVCQHGLEGRPSDVADPTIHHHNYWQFAAQLARRGFVTFAPQNLYIFRDRFRTLQRKANPLQKTLFSVIVPQHQQIVDWLATLPFVDPERIAFYGLSYGGKAAMRIPPLVEQYCLSICSADFNEWVDKNASTTNPRSYVFMGEYEIFEFDLGNTFNYMEMAALIAPRPFMVERGHFDGVADDPTVAFEFAKVRNLYAARLKIPGRCQIEWFDGPHTINGRGTFRFLHRHLKWPRR